MSAEGVVIPGIVKFLGGIAVGWVLRSFSGGSGGSKAAAASGGGKSKAKPKAKRGVPVGTAAAQRPKLLVPRPAEELKMVLCVNNALGMGKGKIGEPRAAGCACRRACAGAWGATSAAPQRTSRQQALCVAAGVCGPAVACPGGTRRCPDSC